MSTAVMPVNVALVDETGKIPPRELQMVAGALNEQIQADFRPIWHVAATVSAQDRADPMQWAIKILEQLDEPGALGYHSDKNRTPYANVMLTDQYPQTVSHELMEMLADPWGNRTTKAKVPEGCHPEQFGLAFSNDRVLYLVEVADPPEATSYQVGGVPMSDFLYHSWWRSTANAPWGYSRAGGCTTAREVAEGGYVSFANPLTEEWYQCFVQDGQMSIQDIGKFNAEEFGSLREFTDHHARQYRART